MNGATWSAPYANSMANQMFDPVWFYLPHGATPQP